VVAAVGQVEQVAGALQAHSRPVAGQGQPRELIRDLR
jgi:hypothetical protein